jgi:hypothetical protein
MTPSIQLSCCLLAMLSTAAAVAQTAPDPAYQRPNPPTPPVAYVYVSQPTHIDAFAASSTGKLTAVSGSPFPGTVSSMSVNKSYLFGAGDNGTDIYSYSIASDGALAQVAVTNALHDGAGSCPDGLGPLQIDYAGTTLYNLVGSDCFEESYQSFKIEAKGELQYLGHTTPDDFYDPDNIITTPLVVLGNDQYGYGVGCYEEDTPFPFSAAYKRESNGLLTYQSFDATKFPKPKDSENDFYCPYLLAGDPTNHVAVAMQDNSELGGFGGPVVLASYTADSQGNLSTSSTYETMPSTGLNSIAAISISPSGKLVAVGGKGFQVFHFNGASPITPYTGLLQSADQFLQFGWDTDNHLYALSNGQLRVYTVTPTSFEEDSGSPYSVPEASSLIVLSK